MTNNKNLRKNCIPVLDEILFLHHIGELSDTETEEIKKEVKQSFRTGQTDNVIRFLSERKKVSGHPEYFRNLLELF